MRREWVKEQAPRVPQVSNIIIIVMHGMENAELRVKKKKRIKGENKDVKINNSSHSRTNYD